MKYILFLLFAALITACSHPLEIVGEGDIISSTGKNNCLLENQPCSNYVANDYIVTYTGEPREGWSFVGWQGCGTQYPDCSLNVPAATVNQFWFQVMPPLRAVFSQALGPGVPGLRVGDVRGNTVQFGSAAEFTVALNTQPQADVTFFVTSTAVGEGIPEVNEFTFTPLNWSQQQTVVVRGQNVAPDDLVQDYHIVFGPTMSADPLYDGLYTPAVAMKGLSLEIVDPPQPIKLLAGSEAQLGIGVQYTGYDALTFAMTASPEGMSIDPDNGLLTWTPQPSDEGQTFPVIVTATDGVVSDEVTFEISVLQPSSLVVTNTADSVTVEDGDSSLNGLNITSTKVQPQSNFAQLGLKTLVISDAPAIPAWITPISDVLVIQDIITDEVEVRIALSALPNGVALDDINLYVYTKTSAGEEYVWLPASIDYHFEGTTENPVYVCKLAGLRGLAVLGFHLVEPAQPFSAQARRMGTSEQTSSISDVYCEPTLKPFKENELNYDKQICKLNSNSEIEITVEDFGEGTRWRGGATIEELAQWLIDAREKMTSELHMVPDLKFRVKIGGTRGINYAGNVSSADGWGVLYLNSSWVFYSKDDMKTTAVHEYFHHGQARTTSIEEGKDFLIDHSSTLRNWIIEGSAEWFEDFVYDTEDPYRDFRTPVAPILESSLFYPAETNASGRANPYARFAFIKLLSEKCTDFGNSVPNLFYVESSDHRGVNSLINELSLANCNFGTHLGNDKKYSLNAAMVYYQYATLLQNDMTLLDSIDEGEYTNNFQQIDYEFTRDVENWFDKGWLETVQDWLERTNTTSYTLKGRSALVPTSAYSFVVPEIEGNLPPNYTAELVMNVEGGGEVFVSIMSKDANFIGIPGQELGGYPHKSFSVNEQSSVFHYGSTTGVPELFVTIVNPSLDTTAKNVQVSFNIVEVPIGPTIPLNDTGITFGGNYPSGNNAGCTGVTIEQQDCSHGRDANPAYNSNSDGHAGFSYTKLSSNGTVLPASATSWACVKDNVTGLVWEMKARDGGIHDWNKTYRWGGKTVQGSGYGTYYPDWNVLVDGSNNEALCGFSNGWRVPTRHELQSIVNYNRIIPNPFIDTAWFPNTSASNFWSASPSAGYSSSAALSVYFYGGGSSYDSRDYYYRVRLVRAVQ